MKFAKIFNLLALLAMIAFGFTFTSCDKNSAVGPEDENSAISTIEDSEYAVYEFEDEMAAISDATLDSDMTANETDPQDHDQLYRNRGKKEIHARMVRQGLFLKHALQPLNLTEEQRAEVKEFLAAFRECVKTPIIEFREAAQPIFDDAHAQRQAIKDSVAAGVYAREEAREMIKTLNEEKRAELETLAEDLGVREAVCECKKTLLDNIASILDETQLHIFEDWMATLDGSCFADDTAEDTTN